MSKVDGVSDCPPPLPLKCSCNYFLFKASRECNRKTFNTVIKDLLKLVKAQNVILLSCIALRLLQIKN